LFGQLQLDVLELLIFPELYHWHGDGAIHGCRGRNSMLLAYLRYVGPFGNIETKPVFKASL